MTGKGRLARKPKTYVTGAARSRLLWLTIRLLQLFKQIGRDALYQQRWLYRSQVHNMVLLTNHGIDLPQDERTCWIRLVFAIILCLLGYSGKLKLIAQPYIASLVYRAWTNLEYCSTAQLPCKRQLTSDVIAAVDSKWLKLLHLYSRPTFHL